MSPEDQKLVALARSAKARNQAEHGAAVSDETGRSYAGATVCLPSLNLTALEVAVAQAVAAGARGLEAAVVVSGHAPATSAVAELAGPGVPVWHCDSRGDVLEELTT